MTYLYVVRFGHHCKIGISRHPVLRMGAISRVALRMFGHGSPSLCSLAPFASDRSARAAEAALHCQFLPLRVANEWFRFAAPVVAYCKAVGTCAHEAKGEIRPVVIDRSTHLKLKQAAVGGKPIRNLIRELVDRFLPRVTK